jgi:hypothetical protein
VVLGGGGNFKGWGLVGGLWAIGDVPLRGMVEPHPSPHSFSASGYGHKLSSFALSKTTGSTDHGLTPPNCESKCPFSLYKLIISDGHYSNRKLINAT